ncbi:MAG: hypothetical protein H6673_09780 [Anaerolineales bacterium]|nr:hypothetical protein [Anaerolineales bacterium]
MHKTPTQTSIATLHLRQHMGEVLEEVYYNNAQFLIARKNKVMARLVNDTYFSALEKLVKSDTSLEDTLWLMLDKQARSAIYESLAEREAEQKIPLDQAFAE